MYNFKKKKKLKIELPYDQQLGIYQKKTKTLVQKEIYTPMFIAALLAVANIWKHPKCSSTDEWIKMWYIYTYIYHMKYTVYMCVCIWYIYMCVYIYIYRWCENIYVCVCVCVCVYIYWVGQNILSGFSVTPYIYILYIY